MGDELIERRKVMYSDDASKAKTNMACEHPRKVEVATALEIALSRQAKREATLIQGDLYYRIVVIDKIQPVCVTGHNHLNFEKELS